MDQVKAGNLRHRVTLQRQGEDPEYSPSGELIEGWQDVGTYWAWIRPVTGQEAVNARQVVATVSHKITMRVVGPITTEDQFIFAGRVLTIGSVIRPNEVNDYFEILASEVK